MINKFLPMLYEIEHNENSQNNCNQKLLRGL